MRVWQLPEQPPPGTELRDQRGRLWMVFALEGSVTAPGLWYSTDLGECWSWSSLLGAGPLTEVLRCVVCKTVVAKRSQWCSGKCRYRWKRDAAWRDRAA